MMRFFEGKDKHKKKAEPNIEFVSPYPLEDCVWQLQNFPGVGEWFPIKTRVEMSQVDDETWAYKVHKTYFSVYFLTFGQRNPLFMYFVVQATGSLRLMPSSTTLVLGKIKVSTSTYLINTLLLFLASLSIFLLIFAQPYSGQFVLLSIILGFGVIVPLLMTLLGLIPINPEQYIYALRNDLAKILGNKDYK